MRIKIVPPKGSRFDEIETSVPFHQAASLSQGVTTALGNLRDYCHALAAAAMDATKVYR
jgi:hypothetical protein